MLKTRCNNPTIYSSQVSGVHNPPRQGKQFIINHHLDTADNSIQSKESHLRSMHSRITKHVPLVDLGVDFTERLTMTRRAPCPRPSILPRYLYPHIRSDSRTHQGLHFCDPLKGVYSQLPTGSQATLPWCHQHLKTKDTLRGHPGLRGPTRLTSEF